MPAQGQESVVSGLNWRAACGSATCCKPGYSSALSSKNGFWLSYQFALGNAWRSLPKSSQILCADWTDGPRLLLSIQNSLSLTLSDCTIVLCTASRSWVKVTCLLSWTFAEASGLLISIDALRIRQLGLLSPRLPEWRLRLVAMVFLKDSPLILLRYFPNCPKKSTKTWYLMLLHFSRDTKYFWCVFYDVG